MAPSDEASLVAVVARGPRAAAAIARAWDRGDAVAPLDPGTPAERLRAKLEHLRATHRDDGDGVREITGGLPVPAAVGAVIATSGTTGEPKAVQLDHAALAASARAVHAAIGHEPNDAWLCCLPVHSVAGLAILARSRTVGTRLFVHDGFAVDAASRAPADGATLVSLVATMLHRLLERDAPVERFRAVLLGGGPAPRHLVEAATQRGTHVATTYGQTETGGGCVHDGHPLPGVEVRLGEHDQILVRGPVVMRGYHRGATATAQAFTADGWLRTGDVGVIDTDGRFHVVDRLRDMVITGGVNVSPTAVEEVLLQHPAVDDVCITGADDPEWGERVVAHVVTAAGSTPPSLESLRAFARDHLVAAELPRELRLVPAIPRTSAGKPRRSALRGTGSSGAPTPDDCQPPAPRLGRLKHQ
jgi:O-succinylbenzoic acid--CoA ligase